MKQFFEEIRLEVIKAVKKDIKKILRIGFKNIFVYLEIWYNILKINIESEGLLWLLDYQKKLKVLNSV